MGTTARGIPYPDDSSPVANLQDHLQSLAESVDDAIDDVVDGTAWTSLTITPGGPTAGVTAAYRIIGGFVAIRLGGSVTALATETTTQIVTSENGLPPNARPAASFMTGCQVGFGGGWMGVLDDGRITIRHEGGSDRTGVVSALHLYPLG